MRTEEEKRRILVVDDEEALLNSICEALVEMGYESTGVTSPKMALSLVKSWEPDALITDLRMPEMDGLLLTRAALAINPELPVVMLTGFGTLKSAVEAMRQGVYDYLLKPFDLDDVDLTLKKAIAQKKLERQARGLATALNRAGTAEGIIGSGSAIKKTLAAITAVSSTDSTVLITGESGTGKELAARAIHNSGPRRERPFVTVDCASILSTVIESELFGHTRGAFTGAHADRTGLFEAAGDGTIFLDEIGELDLSMQKKFLRVIEERSYVRIGENRRREAPARIVAATNRDLKAEAAAGRFREDLYYRLKVVEIRLPALRERKEDIPELCRHYVPRIARRLGRRAEGLTPAALRSLVNHDWPGNVRELINVIEQSLTFHDPKALDEGDLPDYVVASATAAVPSATFAEVKDRAMEDATREYLLTLLRHYNGNITRIAGHADTDRRHMHRLLKKFGLDQDSFRSGE